jgi:cell division protein FtsZ
MAHTEFVAIGTDATTLARTRVPRKLLLESKRLRSLGTGGDPARGARAAEENLSELNSLCQGNEIVFVVTGLGGGTGTGVSPVVARVARQAGALVTGFAVLPFTCEGEARALNAARGLEGLKAAADGVICLSNDKVLNLIDEQAGVADAFDKVGELMAEGLKAVWRLVNLKGPVELNFEDLCTVLKDRHSECLFAVAEGSGTDRVAEVLERLHAHPLLDEGRDLERADAVLVSVVSGSQLGMAEINRLMADLNERCSRARVAMGVGLSDEFAGRLVVTVIASCRGASGRGAATEPEMSGRSGGVADEESDELFPRLVDGRNATRNPQSRFVPPPPELSPDRLQQVGTRHRGGRKSSGRLRQEQLPLEVVSKGRFEKGEPTIRDGQDLDVPTYVRLGASLN